MTKNEQRVLVIFLGMILGLVVGTLSRAHAQGQPTLTELQQAKIENLNLRAELRKAMLEADTCRGQLAEPRTRALADQEREELQKLKADVDKSHPGFVWDTSTGQFVPQAPPKEPTK